MADLSNSRARHIVTLAAKQSNASFVKRWLQWDEFGGHEKTALMFLEKSEPRATELGLTEAQVDAAIAVEVALLATQAALAHAQKTQAEKRRRKGGARG